MEAAALGIPIIASKAGGLEDYFSEDEVFYVSCGDPQAIRDALYRLLDDQTACERFVSRAYHRVITSGYYTRDYARRYVDLSREILDGR
jgi:glycosyltransferase involved in cell wall biosynthesis